MSTTEPEVDVSTSTIDPPPSDRRAHRLAVARMLPASYFAGITLLIAWPLLLGRSWSVVPGFQAQLWPWRGVVDTGTSAALQVDGAASSYPWSVSYHHALRRLELPFWDWHSFSGGYDLASDGVAGAMYPVHWVLWWAFEPLRAHDVYVVLHLWAGGLLMYLLLRHWRLAIGPALVGGTAWMLAPYNVGWAQAEMMTPILVVVPLTFLAVSAAIARGTFPRVLGASAALALAMVAGNIVVFLLSVWVVGLWAVATWVHAAVRRSSFSELRRRAVTLVAIGIGGFALSAYSVVPTVLNLVSLGRRPSTLEESLPPPVNLTSTALRLWTEPDISAPIALFMLGWCGRVVLVLAILGLVHRGGKRALALTLVLVFTLLPGTPWLVHVAWYALPPLQAVAGLGRLTFLASFGMAVLAASGTAVLLHLLNRALVRMRVQSRRRSIGAVAVGLTATAVLVELLPFGVAVNPTWTDTHDVPLFPETAVHDELRRQSGEWPALLLPLTSTSPPRPDGLPYYSFWGATAHIGGIDSVGGYDSAVPGRATAMSRVMEGTPLETAVKPFSTAYLPSFGIEWTRLDLAQRLGVTHVYTPPGADLDDSVYAAARPDMRLTHRGPDGDVWELTEPMRGPRLVSSAVVVDSHEAALAQFISEGHDARNVVVLEDRGAAAPSETAALGPTGRSVGRVESSSRGYDEAHVEVVTKRPSWLVMPIGFAEGWRAEVDGTSLDIRPADGTMSAVRVPRGSHSITFTYRPEGFAVGASTTCLALVLGLGWLLASRLRRPRRRRP